MRRKLCRCCRKLYLPHPQTYRQQKTCDKASCRAWRKSRALKCWRLKNPFYDKSRENKLKSWRESHSGYWKEWRELHPAYEARNLKAQKARDARKRGFLAKRNEWRAFWLQKLEELREIQNLRDLAKRNAWESVLACQIDGVVRYLRNQVLLAKRNDIDRRGLNVSQ